MSSLQLLVVLLSLSNAGANHCNIFSEEFQSNTVALRCNKIRQTIEQALWRNNVYKYIVHEVFSIKSFHRMPNAIIFRYEVKTIARGGRVLIINSITGHGPFESTGPNDSDNVACAKENCTFNVGWSSVNMYTFVRPEFILSLQPAWFLNSLKFSIHEHFGFLREVTLHIHLHKDDIFQLMQQHMRLCIFFRMQLLR